MHDAHAGKGVGCSRLPCSPSAIAWSGFWRPGTLSLSRLDTHACYCMAACGAYNTPHNPAPPKTHKVGVGFSEDRQTFAVIHESFSCAKIFSLLQLYAFS